MIILVLSLATLGVGEAAQLYAAAPSVRGQYHRAGAEGGFNYGYNTGDGTAKVEVKREDGSVVGSWRYFDPYGRQIVRSYIADSKGFRILGNDLPVDPDTPAAAIVGAPALTGSVEGAAPEVVELAQSPLKEQNTVDIQSFSPTLAERSDLLPENPAETVPSNAPSYFVYHDTHQWDFPAGFAYPGVAAEKQEPEPEPQIAIVGIGAADVHQDEQITAGRRGIHRQARFSVTQGDPQLPPLKPFIAGRT